MATEKKSKIVFESEINCPHCEKQIVVRKTRTMVSPAEPAEYDEEVVVEKGRQKGLEDEYEEP